MGLGKTVMALALLADEKYEGLNLVVVPNNVAKQWIEEIKVHCGGHVSVLDFGNVPAQKRKKMDLNKYNVIIITYGTLGSEYKKFMNEDRGENEKLLLDYSFRRVILDEAHNIKCPKTLQFKSACALKSDFSWCLTGTLVQNS